MIAMNVFRTIKHYKRDGFSIREISKKMKISRITVRKYYHMSNREYVEYENQAYAREHVFEPFRDQILSIFEVNDNKVYASSIYDLLAEQYGENNLPGSERTLRNYVQWLRENGFLDAELQKRVYNPVEELPFGKQLQVDFGQIEIASTERVYIFAAVLSASRYRYVSMQNRPFTALDVIIHLLDCFDHIGGIPEQIAIDQDRTMVVSENSGDIVLTKTFAEFKEEMGFDLYVCRKADPESKGKVENLVKFVKTSFFSARTFHDFKDIEPKLHKWLHRRANGQICQSTGRIPANLLQKEQACLKPLRSSIFKKDNILDREMRKADSKSFISVGSSKYSVPFSYRNKKVWIYQTSDQICIYDDLAGKEIARHKIALIPGSKVFNKNHFRDMSQKQQELKAQLLKRFPMPLWKDFIERNFAKYKRYFRQQHEQIDHFLKDDINLDILEKAIRLCFVTGHFSANNLEESYWYEQGICEQSQPDILGTLITGIAAIKKDSRNPKVARRKLSYYTSLISIAGGLL